MSGLGFVEAGVVGLVQGVTELFPVSSLAHAVLLPALLGGRWARDLNVAATESPYLAYIVGLHVATAVALLVYFRRDWYRIIGGFLTSVRDRRADQPDQRLAWLLILATIPVGVTGLAFEHTFRTRFGKPLSASLFLIVNAAILLVGERLRRRGADEQTAADNAAVGDRAAAADRRLGGLGYGEGVAIGAAQIGALAAGVSRSGITMTAGLLRGLSHEDAARFSFLLATPVIFAAGLLKLPDLFGHLGDGIRGQVLFGSVLAGLGAYASVRFLDRYFQTRTLTPFAVYSLLVGGFCAIRFGLF